MRALLAAAVLTSILALAAGAASRGHGFSATVDNPWFPLEPGTRYVYTGQKDGRPTREVVTVTSRTITVDRVPCAVVDDRLWVAGLLRERTNDWYSQDARGNVWYLGEDTADLDGHGHVTSTEGAWRAGVGGARGGIVVPAHPHVGQTGQPEYWKGHAEDHFRVIGVYPNGLLTEEWSPLEPGILDHKLAVRGVGTVLEQTVKGGDERNELVSVTR